MKTGSHRAISSVPVVKRSKIFQNMNKRDICLHSWFQFLWSFSHKNQFAQSIYDLTLYLAHSLNGIIYQT